MRKLFGCDSFLQRPFPTSGGSFFQPVFAAASIEDAVTVEFDGAYDSHCTNVRFADRVLFVRNGRYKSISVHVFISLFE